MIPVGKYIMFFVYAIISIITAIIIENILNKKYKFSKSKRVLIFLIITILIFGVLYQRFNYHPSHEIM